MPLPGGDADKSGNRYEARWTIRCLTDLLREQANSIRLEPPGTEAEGAEFLVVRDGVTEYHQVKRQRGGAGRWSLTALEGERVLSRFWDKLRGSDNHCVFVSMDAADDLRDLADRARGAQDWDEYRTEFLSGDLRDKLDKLRGYWDNCTETEALTALRRIRVVTYGEDTLREDVEYRLSTLIDAEPAVSAAVMAQLAFDRVHHRLTAHDLWQHLDNLGLPRRSIYNDPHVLSAVRAANDRYLNYIRDDAIAGTVLPREEVATALAHLTDPAGSRGVLLSGDAGSGKSGVALQIVEAVRERGWPVLAFRIDRLETMQSPKDVGRQLELRDSPVTTLAMIARESECLLLIDQLDAVSQASGRNPQYFDCVGEMLRQASVHPNMRLALLCRKFDIDNDPRLRRLAGPGTVAVEVPVGRLKPEAVREVVERIGLDAARLTERQVDLLSVPLHLKLLAEVADTSQADVLSFTTPRDLYAYFWDDKQDVISARIGRPVAWADVIDALCDDMSARQSLSASQDIVARHRQDARAMASERVLVADGARYAFFHETFFDYAYARRFVARGNELLSLLTGGEQHLFRRAQVRQILHHERENDWDRYRAHLEALLSRSDIRFHIKQVVFALLAQLPDPVEEEWRILAPFLGGADTSLGNEAWGVLCATPWFLLLDRLGVVQAWLDSGDRAQVDQAVRFLALLGRQIPDAVVEKAETFVGREEAWRERLIYLVASSSLEDSRRGIDLLLRLIADGTLDDAQVPFEARGGFSLFLYELPKKHPDWACEVIGTHLNRRLALSLGRGQANPFDGTTGTIADVEPHHALQESAKGAPGPFVAHVLPFMMRVMDGTADRERDLPWRDIVWRFRLVNFSHGMSGALMNAMETALRLLAQRDPDGLADYVPILRAECETAQFLLVRTFEANGAYFANQAADYLSERPHRLCVGYVGQGYWAARQLLAAITPYCSEDRLRAVEAAVLAYYPIYERSAHAYHKGFGTSRGWAQLTLLNGLNPARRSRAATRRLQEWQRKFRRPDDEPPRGIMAGSVGSPIPAWSADKMKDEHWLRAVGKIRAEHDPRGGLGFVGGAHELSWELEALVKRQPQRFADLALRFPDDTPSCYLDAVLRGLADMNRDVETALRVCRRCHALPGRPCGRWIARPIASLGERDLPEELLEIVAWYATESPDPEVEWWRTRTESGGVYDGGDPFDTGLNSVRGGAAIAMAELIFARGEHLAFFRPTVARMVHDRSVAVRSCVAEVLTAALNIDRDWAVTQFLSLAETEDVLLGTQYVERFLYHATYTHYDRLAPVLQRALASNLPRVRGIGARMTCLNVLRDNDASALAQECLSGDEVMRKAAAEIFAANVARTSTRTFCEQALVRLFDDEAGAVREEAASCFRHFEGDEIGAFTGFVEAFARSRAFPDRSLFLFYALEKTTARLPETMCLVLERFLEVSAADCGDVRTGAAAGAVQVGELTVRLYEQSTEAATKTRCLDIIDRLSRLSVYSIGQILSALDR